MGHRPRTLLAFALVALAASVPRFGQRENEARELSDSDYYLDMAEFFSGVQDRPDPLFADPSNTRSHHYTRPLLPFLAGSLGRLLGHDYRTAFSLLNVIAAWLVAVLLTWLVATWWPGFGHPWAPGFLFLVSFPQMNWGYHILTDTFGYATTLAATLAAVHLMDIHERVDSPVARRDQVLWLGLAVLLQGLAFLTRQTAWITVIAVVVVLQLRGISRRNPFFSVGLVAALVLAVVPYLLYVRWIGIQDLKIPIRPDRIFDPRYIADALIKSGVAFHLAWIPALLVVARREFGRIPDVVLGWGAGALLYIGAGYLLNSYEGPPVIPGGYPGGGYPLRLTFALFPLVLPLAVRFFDVRSRDRPPRALWAFGIAYAAIGLVGVFLDPSRGRLRVFDLLKAI